MGNSVTQLHNVTPEEFKKEILLGVEQSLIKFSKNFQPKEPSVWLTRKELKEMLSIGYTTIHEWCKKGILIPYTIGKHVRFKRSDIIELIESSKKLNLKESNIPH